MPDEEVQKRESVKPEEELELREILQVEVPQERVERLKKLTSVDDPTSPTRCSTT